MIIFLNKHSRGANKTIITTFIIDILDYYKYYYFVLLLLLFIMMMLLFYLTFRALIIGLSII